MSDFLKEGRDRVNELIARLHENRIMKESVEERAAMMMGAAFTIMAKSMHDTIEKTVKKKLK